MRLLLDAHVSGRAIGKPLREAGHDVLAIGESAQFEAMDDVDVLVLAAREQRVLVTFDVQDFTLILQEWAGEARQHAGCVLVVGMDHRDFGPLLRGLTTVLAERPNPADWRNVVLYLSHASAQR